MRFLLNLRLHKRKFNKVKRFLSIIASVLLSVAAGAQVVDPEPGFLTADGPYFFNDDSVCRTVSVGLDGRLVDSLGVVPDIFEVVSHDGEFRFNVRLHEVRRQPWFMEKTEKTYIISDPHGRMDCLVSILQAGGVIDNDLKWSFGPNRLIIIGDVMDRGDDVTQIYWLLYELELEAGQAGGSLVFVYGNHEPMVLGGDLRYTRAKYKSLADSLNLTVPSLYGRNTVLGNWLANANTMVMVGGDLFVHAGLSKDFADKKLSIPEVNELCSRGAFMTSSARKSDSDLMRFLFKNQGPLWYRGFFPHNKKYGKRLDRGALEAILRQYGASRVFVGHTVFSHIRTFYGGMAVTVDVDAKINRDKGRSRAVLMDGCNEYVVFDSGKKQLLN